MFAGRALTNEGNKKQEEKEKEKAGDDKKKKNKKKRWSGTRLIVLDYHSKLQLNPSPNITSYILLNGR